MQIDLETISKYNEQLVQAKIMEKKQVILAYYCGADDESDHHGAMYKGLEDAEKYYNQTYNL